jgi:hypothetical protein
MQVKVLRVEGLDISCEAVRLSFNSESNMEIVEESQELNLFKDDVELLKKLIVSGDSHSKVMRMATVWLDLTMPRYWWSEADQCKVGFVTMSESTAHRLLGNLKAGKVDIESNFEYTDSSKDAIQWMLEEMTLQANEGATTEELKQMLPEAFLQRRIVCTNYQTLRHIYFDRRNHRLPIWHKFLDELLMQLPFPEFITIEKEK